MRRDPIFYQMFQRSPQLLFDLIGLRPSNADNYRFDSVAIKEPKFEIDGVFLPPEAEVGVVYFCEVQMQKDELLYERLFGESFLYFYRNRSRFTDWQAVLIYPSRNVEQTETYPYIQTYCVRCLLDAIAPFDYNSIKIIVKAKIMNAIKRTVSVSREGSIEITNLDLAEGTIVEVILLVNEIDEDEEKKVEFAREAYRNGDFLTLEQYDAQR